MPIVGEFLTVRIRTGEDAGRPEVGTGRPDTNTDPETNTDPGTDELGHWAGT